MTHRDPDGSFPVIDLPLVSVVIVNYNYGRFLADAVGSVFGQTYPRVECILVDNASTDSSPHIIAELEARFPSLQVVRRLSNDGQTPASLDGFAASAGQYVIFLDADDFLLPRGVEIHVCVHLSMRSHVGCTSGDMLQAVGNDVVLSTGEESSRYIRSGRGRRRAKGRVRLYRHEGRLDWPPHDLRSSIEGKIHYVPPLRIHWIWSPTSGLCYRRDALLLFADNPDLASLRTGTDMYFALGCSGLSGSVLIDEPVFAYRIHGGNVFTQRAQLDRLLNFTPGGHGDNNARARLTLIDHMAATPERFAPSFILALNYLALVWVLDRSDPDKSLPRWARQSRLAQGIVRNYARFSDTVGSPLARFALAWTSKTLRSPAALERSIERAGQK